MKISKPKTYSSLLSTAMIAVVMFWLAASPLAAHAAVIWSGDFSTGNFLQYHRSSSASEVVFGQIPPYGRPTQYGGQLQVGDGSLLSLVKSPTRGGPYAAKFTVKNSLNGSEPADCDGTKCTRRRTELSMQATLSDYYNAMPYMSERWMSFSVYVPGDWDGGGSSWGPTVFQVKPRNEYGLSPNLSFSIEQGRYWKIFHRWSPVQNPADADVPWQQQMFYAGNEGGAPYPRSDNWADGLRDFPDVAASHAALKSVRKGGWTDWVVHVKFDARGSDAGGTGFMTIWKREESGPWVKVLHILPKKTTRGGMTFDHGIGYNSPAGSNNGGFGIKTGMYLAKEQVWNLAANRVIYHANIKVGDQNTKFSEMSHDGSSPESSGVVEPKPPQLLQVQ